MMRLALMGIALAFGSPRSALAGYVFDDSSIRTAVDAWLSNPAAAEATYGHISTWETGGVTDMSRLFCGLSGISSCKAAAQTFNEDIGAWDTSGVTTMYAMFYKASAFDQDLGWCVGNDVSLENTFSNPHDRTLWIGNTPCASTLCGVNWASAARCGGSGRGTIDDSTIKTAVRAWTSNPVAAEAAYGHISTWETGRVRNMKYLFYVGDSSAGNHPGRSFNEDISAWDTSGVTSMSYMFWGASAFNQNLGDWRVDKVTEMVAMFDNVFSFDQDLGWCFDDDVKLKGAFDGTKCESTFCGVAQKDVIGLCEPWSPPCLIRTRRRCYISSGTLIIIIIVVILPAAYVHRRKKEDETYVAAARRLFPDSQQRAELLYSCLRFCCRRKKDPIIVNSWPISPAESPRKEPDEEATAPESLETHAAAKAKAAPPWRPPGFTRKLSSFLFGEQEEASKRTEPDPAAPKFEEMYNQIAAWYKKPGNAGLRARWGPFPEPEEFQTWPGFVRVTNAFLDATVLDGEAVTSPGNVVVDAEPVSPGISFWGQFH